MKHDEYISPDDLYKDFQDSWDTLWDDSLTLFQNTLNICRQFTCLPDIFLELACLYILSSQKWAKILGVLFLYGREGTGKSTLGILANHFHGLKKTFSPTDTFPSIRNELDSMRWFDPLSKKMERDGALLVWDNIYIDTLKKDNRLYQFLLFGYNRSTDRIQIAMPDGENKEFQVFSAKILSSIEPIHEVPEFQELRRRLLIISFKKSNQTPSKEINDFDWSNLYKKYFEFWQLESNCRKYVIHRKSLKKPSSISNDKWLISIDLICTGLITGRFSTPNQGIQFFEEYWNLIDSQYSNKPVSEVLVEEFIEKEIGDINQKNNILTSKGLSPVPEIIEPKKLKMYIDALKDKGLVEKVNLALIMNKLGWKMTNKGWMKYE